MDRGNIVREFYELRQYLNRANKLSNEKSEVRFAIERTNLFDYHFYAVCVANFEFHRLALAVRDMNRTWERTSNSKFRNLEEFIALGLNQFEDKNYGGKKVTQISQENLSKMEKEIESQLKMLLLNKNYEP